MTRRWLSAAMCAALLLSALRASAAAPDPKTLKEAQERLEEGNRLYHEGNYDGARVAFEQSIALIPHGATYRNLARAEMKLGDPLAALRHFRLAVADPELDAKRRTITKHELDEAYSATGHVAVVTSPGASVMVDGDAVAGTAPFADAIDVKVGKHTLEARLGAQSATADVDAKAGQVSSIELSIPPAGPPSPTPPVASEAAPSPPPTRPMPELPPQEGSPSFWNTRREIGVGVAAAGVVALGVSVYFIADGNSQGDRANSLTASLPTGACVSSSPPSGCGAAKDARDAQSSDATLRNVFLGAGAAAVLVGAGLFFWPTSNHSQTAIVPFITPGIGGLQLRGEF